MGKFKQPFLAALYLTGIMISIWHLSQGINYAQKFAVAWLDDRAEYERLIKQRDEMRADFDRVNPVARGLDQYPAGYVVGSTTGPVTCAGAGCTQHEVTKIVSCVDGGCTTYDGTGVTFASPTFVTPTLTNPDTGSTITSGTLTMSGGTGTTTVTLPSSGTTSAGQIPTSSQVTGNIIWGSTGSSGLAIDDDGWPNVKDGPWDKVKEARVCK